VKCASFSTTTLMPQWQMRWGECSTTTSLSLRRLYPTRAAWPLGSQPCDPRRPDKLSATRDHQPVAGRDSLTIRTPCDHIHDTILDTRPRPSLARSTPLAPLRVHRTIPGIPARRPGKRQRLFGRAAAARPSLSPAKQDVPLRYRGRLVLIVHDEPCSNWSERESPQNRRARPMATCGRTPAHVEGETVSLIG
jgi:hypothetical protein